MSLRRAFALVALSATLFGIHPAAHAGAPEPTQFGDLCMRTQMLTASIDEASFRRAGGNIDNVDYTDPAAFAASKPQVKPLTTTRFDTDEDGVAKQVRCKGKSADAVTAAYGPYVAGGEGDCASANRRTVWEASIMLSATERMAQVRQLDDIVIDPDTQARSGPEWLADFPTATKDSDGRVHLPSKSLLVPLSAPNIPEAFKGQHYCTLAAHAYVKRLLLGQALP
ncbi:hypothetical protein [Nocardia jejuensis]|uniref:hypothetical protein n=1 Tax=Nocardia jejuensis TaxID=328049 RepID=UPI00082C9CCC|nr:hypothetical protein [Nocardia jejuensis]